MKVEEECIPCILKMSLNGLRSLNLEPYKQREIYHEFVKSIMTENDIWNITSAELVERILIKLIDETAVPDPLARLKEKANSQLLSIYDNLKNSISKCDDPILMATKLSIFWEYYRCNGIKQSGKAFKKAVMASAKNLPLNIENYKKLLTQFENSKSLLIIADNAGEAVMDKLLIEMLKEKYNMEIYYAVRNNPALNDITYDEAVNIGFLEFANVITNGINGPLPGTVLSRCSQDFLQVLNSVDVVIAKGGGNFESLIGEPKLPPNTFFFVNVQMRGSLKIFSTTLLDRQFYGTSEKKTSNKTNEADAKNRADD